MTLKWSSKHGWRHRSVAETSAVLENERQSVVCTNGRSNALLVRGRCTRRGRSQPPSTSHSATAGGWQIRASESSSTLLLLHVIGGVNNEAILYSLQTAHRLRPMARKRFLSTSDLLQIVANVAQPTCLALTSFEIRSAPSTFTTGAMAGATAGATSDTDDTTLTPGFSSTYTGTYSGDYTRPPHTLRSSNLNTEHTLVPSSHVRCLRSVETIPKVKLLYC